MTKYRLGDSVRVTAHPSCCFDQVGTVTDVDPGAYHQFRVSFGAESLWFGPHELVLAEWVGGQA